MSIGAQDIKYWPITSQNIIHYRITKVCKRCIHASVSPMNQLGIRDSALWGGGVNTQGTAGANLIHLPHGR
jgi:hypothetical protein